MPAGPLRLAIVNDYEIVVAGTAAVLASYADRVHVVELDTRSPVVTDVDIVLYDSFGQIQGPVIDFDELTVDRLQAKVVIFSWNTDPDLVQHSLRAGAHGYVSKAVSADELVDALERVHGGEQVSPNNAGPLEGDDFGRWPGAESGLSPREAEVLALICQGYSNQDISQRSFLGVNTIKTHIRTLYRKIGVDSRTRAVLWGLDHGFQPDQSRNITN